MIPSNPVTPGARWRQACAALMVGASMASLLVACGGGGDAPISGNGAADRTELLHRPDQWAGLDHRQRRALR